MCENFEITLLIHFFAQKYQVGSPSVIFILNLVPIFEKMMQFSNFSLNFLNQIKVFFIKIEVINKDGLLYWYNSHNPNVNFDKKILTPRFKKFN